MKNNSYNITCNLALASSFSFLHQMMRRTNAQAMNIQAKWDKRILTRLLRNNNAELSEKKRM